MHQHDEAHEPNGHGIPDETADVFPGESEEALALLEECRQAHSRGDSAELIALTERLLELPLVRSTDLVHMLRADALFEQSRFDDAAESYRASIAHGAEDFAMAWFKLGCAFAAEAKFEDAALAFWKAGELEPNEYMHRLQMGFALLELERFTDAERVFEQVLSMSSGRRGNYGLAWMHYACAALADDVEAERRENARGFAELAAAVRAGELGEEGVADFPWWHAWINPAFEKQRGTELAKAPLDPAWAELVNWPKDGDTLRSLRDVLLDQPEWD